MRFSVLSAVAGVVALVGASAFAAETSNVKGLFLITDYPAISAQPGTTTTVALKLQNYGLAPERYQLSIAGVPAGWTATLLGGGQPIAAAMPATDENVPLQLRLDIPAETATGAETLTVNAVGEKARVGLPITVALAKELPAKLKLEPALPALRGGAKSTFDYQLAIKNDSGRNLIVSLAATAPRHFETSFTQAYGNQELSSIPVEAGRSKDVKLRVRPPAMASAGGYPIVVTASAEDTKAQAKLDLDIVGEPRLQLTGREGLVSARAEGGVPSSIPIVISNAGGAAASNVELSGSGPSGWTIAFEPKLVESIAPGKQQEVQALITPSAKSLAGDYMTTLRASARGDVVSTQFRVTVSTSTVWGIVGAGIIAVALLIMVGAVARFGRR